jgi:hypothetical protein
MNETPEAVETEEQAIPMTEAVMNVPQMQFNDHAWVQMGYMVYDHCDPQGNGCQYQGIPIPTQTVLVKNGSAYSLRPEYTGPR